jgi:hypothetical protein
VTIAVWHRYQCAPDPPPMSGISWCRDRSSTSGHARAGSMLTLCMARVKVRANSVCWSLALNRSPVP